MQSNDYGKVKVAKMSLGNAVARCLLQIAALVGTFLIAVVIVLLMSLNMLCSDSYPHVQQTFVTTILETGQLKFLASWFLTSEEIQEIVNQNSMKELKAEIDTNLINKGNVGTIDVTMGSAQGAAQTTQDIEVFEVAGSTYTGTMMIVKDPSRVSLATIYPWRAEGVTLDELVTSNDAIAGINGGLYDSTNNTGGMPCGVIVSNGEIQFNKPQQYTGLVLVGFTEDDILQIIDVSDMTPADVEQLVADMKIRDAVTFQEEASPVVSSFLTERFSLISRSNIPGLCLSDLQRMIFYRL